jgi:pseudaminic acid cytidylyltransferase
MSCIAIITARGGSKRILRKNIKNFLGSPIIKYAIDAARNSGCFDEIMVSTDDDEIAAIAIELGATVPFMRSEKTANDFATTPEVIFEVLADYEKIGQTYKYCCCIYPTAVFLSGEKLADAHTIIKKTNAESVVPVVPYNSPILRSFGIGEGLLKMNWPEHVYTRSQDLEPAYYDSGQFYFLDVEKFLIYRALFPKYTVPMIVSQHEVQDIDDQTDWELAEIKYKILYNI